jgi:hypothetical protein
MTANQHRDRGGRAGNRAGDYQQVGKWSRARESCCEEQASNEADHQPTGDPHDEVVHQPGSTYRLMWGLGHCHLLLVHILPTISY